ncbi:uncharacterized protein LOC117301202 [Asterias rubens]|uniref:uncharacterized protein LOC117301202 n=1 Tax=Asterias rubens TaxID=7604 RepID=UPI0014550C40|nr:uncharacterized protein LOC117301202 [Asterias rubens]
MTFFVLLLTCVIVASIAVEGAVNMTSRVTPYQVRFGKDGRPLMEDFEKRTPCGQAPTAAFNEAPRSPCDTYHTSDSDVRLYLLNHTTISFPVRLDFTLKNQEANLTEVRFMGRVNGDVVYTVKFTRGQGVGLKGLNAHMDLQFDGSHRFWVTYENGEVKVGLHGRNGEPLLHYTDPNFTTNQVRVVELHSKTITRTEWTVYQPCFK